MTPTLVWCHLHLTELVYSTINNNDKIDPFTISDGDRLNWYDNNIVQKMSSQIYCLFPIVHMSLLDKKMSFSFEDKNGKKENLILNI